ncbi:MAG: sensor histidine kinase [Acidimicrobiales bacterium]
MFELTLTAAAALFGGAGALALLLLVLAVRAKRHIRSVNRRLAAVTARLEQPGARPRNERDSLGRLEQLAETSVLRNVEAEAATVRLAGALEAVTAGVVVCDETGEVVLRNTAAVVAGAAGADEVIDEVLRAAVAGERAKREVEFFGSPHRSIEVSGHPLDDGHRPVGAVAVVEDRSEGRRLAAVRHDFLAHVMAELRGPVAALDVLAGTIAGDERSGLAPRLAARLATEARRVSRVIEDVTELSALDAGLPPPAGPVAVHLVVAEAVRAAHEVAAAFSVEVKAPEPAPGLTVVGDRRHLVSTLRHLVENAVHCSPAGAAVTVVADTVAGWVQVAVADEGPGLEPGQLDRIFESFYRAGGSGGAGGSGLGLAIAARTAAAHGGSIVVESTPGRGSVFTLRVPAGPPGPP